MGLTTHHHCETAVADARVVLLCFSAVLVLHHKCFIRFVLCQLLYAVYTMHRAVLNEAHASSGTNVAFGDIGDEGGVQVEQV